MKQKIVMKVWMTSDKCRTKAMKIAAVANGVISVALEGPEKDQVVVIGDGVETACLVHALKKKVGYTSLISKKKKKISVEEVTPPKPPDNNDTEEKKVDQCCSSYMQYPPCPTYNYVYCDPNPSGCSIM